MSAQEVVEALHDALGRADREAVSALLHPAVRWIFPRGFPGAQEHRGKAAVEQYLFASNRPQGAVFQTRIDSVHEDDDVVFVRGAFVVKIHSQGLDMAVPAVFVFEVRGGLIENCHLFTDTITINDALLGRL